MITYTEKESEKTGTCSSIWESEMEVTAVENSVSNSGISPLGGVHFLKPPPRSSRRLVHSISLEKIFEPPKMADTEDQVQTGTQTTPRINEPTETSSSLDALFLRVEFPGMEDTPEFKVFSLDPDYTVQQTLRHIQATLGLPVVATSGLYDPKKKVWWEHTSKVSEIPDIQAVELVEYRDKEKKIEMGDVKVRRKKKMASPFTSNWAASFQGQLAQSKEKKKREQELKKVLSEEERSVLEKLDSAKSPNPVPKKTRSNTQTNLKPAKTASYDDSIQGSQTSTSDSTIIVENLREKLVEAAQKGLALLKDNEALKREIEIWRSRDEMRMQLEYENADLKNNLVEAKSRVNYLETQMQDASSQNQKLQETLEEKERQIRGKSQNQEDKEKIQELMDEVDGLKKDLDKARQESENNSKQLQKVKAEKTKLEEGKALMELDLLEAKKERDALSGEAAKSREIIARNKDLMGKVNNLEKQLKRYKGRSWTGSLKFGSEDVNALQIYMKLRRIIGSGKLESGNSKEQVNLVENSQKLMEGMKPKITEDKNILDNLLETVTEFAPTEKEQQSVPESAEPEANIGLDEALFLFGTISATWLKKANEDHKNTIADFQKEKARLEEDLSEKTQQLENEIRSKKKFEEKYQALSKKGEIGGDNLGDELAMANKQPDVSSEQLTKLQTQLEQQQSAKEFLERQLDELKKSSSKDLESLKQEKVKVEGEVKTLKQELAAKEEQLKKVSSELDGANSKLASQSQEKEKDKTKYETEIKTLKDQITEKENLLQQQKEEISKASEDKLKKELQGLKSIYDKQIDEMKKEHQEELKILQDGSSGSEQKLAKLVSEKDQEISKLQDEVKEISVKLQESSADLSDKETQMQNLNKELESTKNKLTELNAEKAKLEKTVADKTAEISAKQDSLSKLNDELKKLKEESENKTKSLEGENKNKDLELTRLQNEIKRISNELEISKKSLEDGKGSSDTIQKLLQAKENEIQLKEEEIKKLNVDLQSSKKSIEEATAVSQKGILEKESLIKSKEDEIRKLKTDLEASQKLAEEAKKLSETVQKQLQSKENDFKAREEEIKKLNIELENSKKIIDEGKKNADNIQKQLQSKEAEVKAKEEDIKKLKLELDNLRKQQELLVQKIGSEQQQQIAQELVKKDKELKQKSEELELSKKQGEELTQRLQQVQDALKLKDQEFNQLSSKLLSVQKNADKYPALIEEVEQLSRDLKSRGLQLWATDFANKPRGGEGDMEHATASKVEELANILLQQAQQVNKLLSNALGGIVPVERSLSTPRKVFLGGWILAEIALVFLLAVLWATPQPHLMRPT